MSDANGDGRWALPEGWVWTTLGEIANPTRERVQPQDYPHLPFIGMDDISSQTMQLLGTKAAGEMRSAAERFWPDDVLYGSLRPYLNKVYRPDFEGLASGEFIVFRSVPHLLSKYLQYFLNQWSFVEFINRQNTGDRPRVKFIQMADYPFPLAPLEDQHRIVAEIEKQFTRLHAAVAALRRARANLARYKAAVLQAAVTGRLVAQDPADEPAGALLGRILAERRAQWEAANPRKQYVEPKGPDVAGLPGLPVGWVWARVEQIAKLIQYGTSDRADAENSGVPVIRMGNIQNGRVSPNNLKYMPNNWTANDLLLENGDVLFNRTNSAELVGKTAVYKGHPTPATFASYLIRLQTVSAYHPEFLSTFINSVYGREYIASVVSQQVGQANVNGTKLANMPVPFPPSDEQRRIIKELESILSSVEATEQVIDANLARADRLRQGVLGRAFRGELV